MSPEQLRASNTMFSGFVQSKATRFVEALNTLLYSDAHPTWMQQGHSIFLVADSAVSKGFLRMTRSAWLLLNLAFSIKPTVEILRVLAGSAFDGDYMEDMTMLQNEEGYGGLHDHNSSHDDDDDDDGHDMVVTFMCFPGFSVSDTIIKSGVCLI